VLRRLYDFGLNKLDRLIMCLILGDLLRALWYMIFASVALSRSGDPLPTASPFCQVSGFFVAFGTEVSGMMRNPQASLPV